MLQVQQLVKHFDGIKAVDGVSFDVAAGKCVALIGAERCWQVHLFCLYCRPVRGQRGAGPVGRKIIERA